MHMKKLMFAVMGLAAVAGGSARAAGIAVDLQSARGVGMAGAMIGVVDDGSGIYFNPAGIAQGQGSAFAAQRLQGQDKQVLAGGGFVDTRAQPGFPQPGFGQVRGQQQDTPVGAGQAGGAGG